jgi:hypothetical protein
MKESGEKVRQLPGLLADLAARQADLARRIESETGQAVARAVSAATHLREGAVEQAESDQAQAETELRARAELLPGSTARELAARQKGIREALERLAAEFARLKEAEVRDRLRALIEKQAHVQQAVRQLPAVQGPASAPLAEAQRATSQAAATLAQRDALAAARHMEQAQTALEQLDRLDPSPTRTAASRKPLKQLEALTREQMQLREQTRQMLAKLSQGSDPVSAERAQVDAKRLLDGLQKLMKDAKEPRDKQLAQDAAQAMQLAQQALAKEMAKPGMSAAGQEAAKALETARQKLEQMSGSRKEDGPLALSSKLAEAMQQSDALLRQARDELQRQPRTAPKTMRRAADALAQSAQQLGQQTRQGIRLPGQDPRPGNTPPGAALPFAGKLREDLRVYGGKRWGELPGELKTRLVQDLRRRYGDDYAPIIQRYFERIADVAPARPLAPAGKP